MSKVYFEEGSKITSVAKELKKDCSRLEKLVEKSMLLDEIVEKTTGANVEIRFSGADTSNITCNLNAMFTQEEAVNGLIAINKNVDAEIRGICSRWPEGMFGLTTK